MCTYRPQSPSKGALAPIESSKLDSKDSSNDSGFVAKDIKQLDDEPRKFDSTGMFHWCQARLPEDAIMVFIY